MKSQRIIIDSTSRILYSSYYIQGLYSVFGKKNVSFGRKPFRDLVRKKEIYSFEHFFAFVLIRDNKTTRYVIDFCDPPDICQNAYDWSDVYAKINFNKSDFEGSTYMRKLIVIPPSFGIKIWNLQETLYYCVKNFFSSPFSLPTNFKKFLRDYSQQYKRAPLENYKPIDENIKTKEKPYIFMIGSLWKETDNAKHTNEKRKRFIKVCKSLPDYTFEGGMYLNKNHSKYEDYKNIMFSKRYSINEYITKTKKSQIVFNTPAVHNCHGWKLAEYLAMGKSILSTHLSNVLPHELTHGKNIHIIKNLNEIESSINTIINNQEYKQLLSQNAKKYFLENMTPNSVINRILNKKVS